MQHGVFGYGGSNGVTVVLVTRPEVTTPNITRNRGWFIFEDNLVAAIVTCENSSCDWLRRQQVLRRALTVRRRRRRPPLERSSADCSSVWCSSSSGTSSSSTAAIDVFARRPTTPPSNGRHGLAAARLGTCHTRL